MKKKYLKLTADQKARGVIFSSELKGSGLVHEVFEKEGYQEIERRKNLLLDDKFFNDSPWKYNLIRQ